MIETFFALLVFQLLGELTVSLLKIPIPGSVAGMALAFLALQAFPRAAHRFDGPVNSLTRNLSLFFVPAGAGLIQYLDLWRHSGVAIVVTIILSTLVTAAVTGVVFQFLLHLETKGAERV